MCANERTPTTTPVSARLVILDIHTLQNQFYFSDNVLIRLESCIYLLRHRLEAMYGKCWHEKVIVAFPDEGALKRFHSYVPELKHVVCGKRREGNDRIIKVIEGEEHLPGAHVIIIDDLVQSGGTLMKCGKVLRKQGAAKVSAYVTHGVFPKESWKRFVREGNKGGDDFRFDHFWMTDSIPRNSEILRDKKPFEILSIASLINFVIKG